MTHLVTIGPLLFEAGDRMSRDEFLARWEQMPNLKFAELIEGVVYLPSPLSHEHGRYDSLVQAWAAVYADRSKIAESLTNCTWLMLESAPQPDAALRLLPEFGGQSEEIDKLVAGAPELAAEVTRSSRSYDLGPKLALYERAGVREYVAVMLEERRIEWRVLKNKYDLLQPDASGIFRSIVFPGLWLDEPAFWRHDLSRVLEVLEEGLRSPECQEFIRRCQTR